jgi:O-acetylserine/cysteine efflux transporter
MLAYVVWSSACAAPVLAVLSLWLEGAPAIVLGLKQAGVGTWLAVIWQAVGNTLFGYGIWAWLLSRHPAASIAPMALLVPVFGMSASSVVLGEPLPVWKWVAAALVMAGLGVNVFWPAVQRRIAAAKNA